MGSIIEVWWLVLIMFGFMLVSYMLETLRDVAKKSDTGVKTLNLILMVGLLVFSVWWLSPTVFNSVMFYLDIDMILNWKEVLPLGFILGFKVINTQVLYRINTLWGDAGKND